MSTFAFPIWFDVTTPTTTTTFTATHPSPTIPTLTPPPPLPSSPRTILWLRHTFTSLTTSTTNYLPTSPLPRYLILTLLLSLPLTFFLAYKQSQRLKQRSIVDNALTRWRRRKTQQLWDTKDWKVLIGMTELYGNGLIAYAPWDGESVRARWGSGYLAELTRMLLIPLGIEEGGGVRTERLGGAVVRSGEGEEEEDDEEEEGAKMGGYVQSKRRAFFEFMMAWPHGCSANECEELDGQRREFIDRLLARAAQHGYRVLISLCRPFRDNGDAPALPWQGEIVVSYPAPDKTVPLERGATTSSYFMPWLPFMRDRDLKAGKGAEFQPLEEFVQKGMLPLVQFNDHAVIRVEAADAKKAELDKWVYGVARSCGLLRREKKSFEQKLNRWLFDHGVGLYDMSRWIRAGEATRGFEVSVPEERQMYAISYA